jgi:hypothetical protein
VTSSNETWYDPTPILEAAAGAFDHSCDEVVATIAAREPHRTGRLAAGYAIQPTAGSETVWWAAIVNPVVYARAVERGAWMRNARGPHMHGNTLVRKTVQSTYGPAMRAAMPAGFKSRRTTVRARKVTL